ncbi:MAG: DUF2156 domain-containing protein [Clostridia bacterium]|jgi:phosphatidylglycerol lysyltransferase|nr:DUF2156 domain-containing protein [Clostridia bacterium]MCI2015557.1 DUF2156 domain-containing protein [Clostridia bacterium]
MKKNLSELIGIINKIAVICLLILAIINIISPLFIFHYSRDMNLMHYFEMHHAIRRFLGFIILLVSWKLYKRVSAAWSIVMVALSLRIFQFLIIQHEKIFNPLFLLEVFCYFLLLLSKNYYCRKMDKYSLKKGVRIFLVYAAFVFFNAVLAHLKERGMASFSVCIKETVDIIFDLNNLTPVIYTYNSVYHSFIFWFSWICILTGLIFLLTPYINKKTRMNGETEKARKIVKKYGQNWGSYLALEKDKSYFFSKSVEGMIAYGIIKDIVVVLGDPICAKEDFMTFLTEIIDYCKENAYSLIFINTTSMFLKQYEKLGLGCVKCGEEPRLYLPEYSIAGGKAAKVRLNINHATKAGITVKEYDPRKNRNLALENEIEEVSQEWFTMKKSGELVFSLGSIGFENPMDKRYFYALNTENKIEGFMVFVPFAGMNGYMADVTRRRLNATRGVMEKILYDAMMKFKEEGIEWGSLAVAPLSRLEKEPEVTAKLLNTIYEKMNSVYGFKALYQTKLKYNPTYWEPNYYVYYPPIFNPAMAYAIVRIQNPLGIKDYIRAFVHNSKKEK